ncbi:uncharacterized protein EV422DRAFT_188129 [Fimicolochytrium jonesii]|uniref:uncharacterized protein n=1 Tax=Fimicolochytrium jonesii TaxID=1396493 RepID=UPI0022FE1B7D|nr:uncharacterized protein EV422DRAFT_188129 [Fimicolochytrium jonesii]KAI8818435.1 hypothetical protein EV422DRAFT_188129 [Fimicolochytrium jonesii]
MSDFPALGGSHPTRELGSVGANGPSLLSFSSIAGGRVPAGAEGSRNGIPNSSSAADFTIDDFPALTPGGGGGGGPQQQQQLQQAQQQHQQQSSQHMLSSHPPDSQFINRPPGNMPTPRVGGDGGAMVNGSSGPSLNGSGGPMSPMGTGMAFGGPSVISGLPAAASSGGGRGQMGGPGGGTPQQSGSGTNSTTPSKRPIGSGSSFTKGQASNSETQSAGSVSSRDPTPTPPGGPTPIPPAGTSDKYGLYGLLDVIRLTDPDANMIHLGCDLTSLGLNLSSNDSLYSTFMSPFSEHPTLGSEPQFNLPGCYNLLQSPPPSMTKVSSFSDETLFYLFYAQPRESLQEAAAQELYNRSWRFHKELKLWVSKDRSPESLAAEAAIATKGVGFERGIFVFFDPGVWGRVKKEWVVYYDQLEERGVLTGGTSTSSASPVNGASTNNGEALSKSTTAATSSVAATVNGVSPSRTSGPSNSNWPAASSTSQPPAATETPTKAVKAGR